jgi:hypothetical protein
LIRYASHNAIQMKQQHNVWYDLRCLHPLC